MWMWMWMFLFTGPLFPVADDLKNIKLSTSKLALEKSVHCPGGFTKSTWLDMLFDFDFLDSTNRPVHSGASLLQSK